MAYEVLYKDNDLISTNKDTDFVLVQIARVSNRQGQVSNRLELRTYVINPRTGYEGTPKGMAFSFDDTDQIDDLIEALESAKAEYQKLPAPQQPKTAPGNSGDKPAPKVRNVGNRKRAASSPRKKATAK